MGSGSVVAQLADEGLIDEYRIVVSPIVLGAGRAMFEGVKKALRRRSARSFANGNVALGHEPTA
jgi:dihydrofolate reductase